MNSFVKRLLIFIFVWCSILIASLFFIPNRQLKDSSLYANIDKHSRLDSLPSPKIIFVGGSNMGFGIDSKMVEDSLKMPVVNMGLHAGLGLRFMINEILANVKKNDIVVLSPEYHHFAKGMFYGEKILVALLVDVNPRAIRYISPMQLLHLLPLAVEYSVSKLFVKPTDVLQNGTDKYAQVYKRHSFNLYGDENMHWDYPNQLFARMLPLQPNTSIEHLSFEAIGELKKEVEEKKGKLVLIAPSFTHSSYVGSREWIEEIERYLSSKGMPFELKPKDEAYQDSLFFNTVYHLNRDGVTIRTNKIISVLKAIAPTPNP